MAVQGGVKEFPRRAPARRVKSSGRASMALLAVFMVPMAVAAPAAEPEKVNLEVALERTVRNSHLLRAARHGEEKAEVSVRRARAERYVPEADVKLEGGVVPAAKGTVLDSPDSDDDVDSLGPFYKVSLEIVQPLYTFGRLNNLERAALEGLGAQKARTELTLQELTSLTIRTYWALVSSRKAFTVAGELRDSFYELLDEVETRLDDEDSEVDDGDRLEVKSSAYRIEKIYLDSRENKRKTAMALRALMGTEGHGEIVTGDEVSPEFPVGLVTFEEILEKRGVANKQIGLLEAASRALASKIALTRSDRYPLVFLAAGAGYARTPNRTDQTNPFVLDDFNYARVGAEVGVAWKANIYKKNLEVEELQREYDSLIEKLEALKIKLAVEASEKYGEAVKNRALLDAAQTSLSASRSWLRLSLDNWEMGLGEVNRLLDAYESYYEMKAIEVEMELEFNLSLASVAAAIGDIDSYRQWLREGSVSF